MEQVIGAQYRATQKMFAEAGVTHVKVWRGWETDGFEKQAPRFLGYVDDPRNSELVHPGAYGILERSASVRLRPLSSFTFDSTTAQQFSALGATGGERRMVVATLPVSRVLATPRTGNGCREESEVIVIGPSVRGTVTDGWRRTETSTEPASGIGNDPNAGLTAAGRKPVEVDIPATDENEDWIKALRWDLPYDTPEALQEAVGDLRHFLTLPAARPMPEALRTAVEAYLTVVASLPWRPEDVERALARVAHYPGGREHDQKKHSGGGSALPEGWVRGGGVEGARADYEAFRSRSDNPMPAWEELPESFRAGVTSNTVTATRTLPNGHKMVITTSPALFDGDEGKTDRYLGKVARVADDLEAEFPHKDQDVAIRVARLGPNVNGQCVVGLAEMELNVDLQFSQKVGWNTRARASAQMRNETMRGVLAHEWGHSIDTSDDWGPRSVTGQEHMVKALRAEGRTDAEIEAALPGYPKSWYPKGHVGDSFANSSELWAEAVAEIHLARRYGNPPDHWAELVTDGLLPARTSAAVVADLQVIEEGVEGARALALEELSDWMRFRLVLSGALPPEALLAGHTAHYPGGHEHNQKAHGGGGGADGAIPIERGPDAMTPEKIAAWGAVIDEKWGNGAWQDSATMTSELIQNAEGTRKWALENATRAGIPAADVESVSRLIAVDAVKDAPVVVRIPEDRFAEVLADGRIKSQFEVQHSLGVYSPRGRAVTEAITLGFDPSRPDAERPIYGAVEGPRSRPAIDYGLFGFELTPEARARTTVTFGDSLSAGFKGLAITDIERGRVTAKDLHQSGNLTYRVGGYLDDQKRRGKYEDGLAGKGMYIDADYIEAQVHGGLPMSDVRRVTFDIPPEHRGHKLLVTTAKAALAKTGKPWAVRVWDPEAQEFSTIEEGTP